ncbi:MAG TPA: reverse transcriptase domain-containing protein, partial [Puia sp.]|nr:reverse transcriptase domain-containing protein [Puia sp.]
MLNYRPSLSRLQTNLKRLRENPEILKEYHNIMLEQLDQGILEEVPANTDEPPAWMPDGRRYYMPHQAVIKETSSTTKLRIVYDASSGRPSLNDCLHRGKVYAGQGDKAVMAILARVRLMPHVLSMDLEKAFLQINLRKEDRDSNRLLWPVDPSKSDFARVLRFTRVTFGIIASPYLLGATIEHHLNQHTDSIAKKLIRGSYVDNFIIGLETPSELQTVAAKSRDIFLSGGFNCR